MGEYLHFMMEIGLAGDRKKEDKQWLRILNGNHYLPKITGEILEKVEKC